MTTGFNPLDLLRRDMERIQKLLGGAELVHLLPKWTATHPWPYHGVAYGFEYPNQVLETDDFNSLPDIGILRTWTRALNLGRFGPIEGQRLNIVDKIVITGPEGFKKSYNRFELVV